MAAASLIAYASTKAALTTFRLCVHSAQIQSLPLSRLPLEIRLIIEEFVLFSTRATEHEYWRTRFTCITDECFPQLHLTDAEDDKLRVRILNLLFLLFYLEIIAQNVSHMTQHLPDIGFQSRNADLDYIIDRTKPWMNIMFRFWRTTRRTTINGGKISKISSPNSSSASTMGGAKNIKTSWTACMQNSLDPHQGWQRVER